MHTNMWSALLRSSGKCRRVRFADMNLASGASWDYVLMFPGLNVNQGLKHHPFGLCSFPEEAEIRKGAWKLLNTESAEWRPTVCACWIWLPRQQAEGPAQSNLFFSLVFAVCKRIMQARPKLCHCVCLRCVGTGTSDARMGSPGGP